MIFTAVGITLLLILVFLLVTWVLWFTFLLLSKLYYEASQTYFNRTSIRTFLNHSFAALVSRILLLYSKTSNRISKMNKQWLLLIPFAIFLGLAWSYGYAQCYRDHFSGQAEMKEPEVFGGVYFLGDEDGPSLYQFPSPDSIAAYQGHLLNRQWLKENLKDSTLLYTEFW